MARILNSDCVSRIHRTSDDSGQNESERSNACINVGDTLVDGGALRWKFHDALVALTQDEIASFSLDDVKKCEELAIEQNARTVAYNVAEGINHEPGPSGDYKERLHQFVSAPDSKRKNIPGAAYFKKLNIFMTEHVHVGELYLKYIS